MAKRRTQFKVRESTAIDPSWEVGQALELWERMLASRLKALTTSPRQKRQEGVSE